MNNHKYNNIYWDVISLLDTPLLVIFAQTRIWKTRKLSLVIWKYVSLFFLSKIVLKWCFSVLQFKNCFYFPFVNFRWDTRQNGFHLYLLYWDLSLQLMLFSQLSRSVSCFSIFAQYCDDVKVFWCWWFPFGSFLSTRQSLSCLTIVQQVVQVILFSISKSYPGELDYFSTVSSMAVISFLVDLQHSVVT